MTAPDKLLTCFPDMEDGVIESPIEGVLFFKNTSHVPRRPMVYHPGICIVFSGHKIGYLGGQKFRYDAKNYLVTTVAMPFECESFASPENPLRGIFISIDMAQLHELIGQMGLKSEFENISEKKLPRGIGPAKMDEEMTDAILRLLKALQSNTDATILGPGLLREILYRALCGTQAPVLYSLAMYSGSFSKVAQVLSIMQKNFPEKLDVNQLAQKAHMSASAFHRAFKEITSDSPMQYLKKIRLTKARDLMMLQNTKAYIAADQVGYESSSQFSREFKRYFGQSPAEMMREMRA